MLETICTWFVYAQIATIFASCAGSFLIYLAVGKACGWR